MLDRPAKRLVNNPPLNYTVEYDYQGLYTEIEVTSKERDFTLGRAYNSQNKLIWTRDANRGTTSYRFDGAGNPEKIVDAKNSTITSDFDGFGNKLWFDDPNMGRWQFTHNALGQLRKQTDARNIVTELVYDELGRLKAQSTSTGEKRTWQYDAQRYGLQDHAHTYQNDNLVAANDSFYDDQSRLIRESQHVDGIMLSHELAYDAHYGRIKGERFAHGEVVAYRYNDKGFAIENFRPAHNGLAEKSYRKINTMSAKGSLEKQTFGNGLVHTLGRHVSDQAEFACAGVNLNPCGDNGAQYIEYKYDGLGNLTRQHNHRLKYQEDYAYDDLLRLESNTIKKPNGQTDSVDYGYDAVGNIRLKDDYAKDYLYGNTARNQGNAGPNAVRQITLMNGQTRSFQYDNNGNLTEGDGRSLTYNSANKPTQITRGNVTSIFTYGTDQSRVKQVTTKGSQTITTYYLGKRYEWVVKQKEGQTERTGKAYVDQNLVISHRDQNTSGALIKQAEATIHYLVTDRLGSVTAVVDGNKAIGSNPKDAVLQQRRYDPFGQVKDDEANYDLADFTGTTRGFTQHEHLNDVELIHMNGRGYDYQLGRFLSVDPIIQAPTSSQSINPYSYIMNNPLSGTDPSGYCSTSDQFQECTSDLEAGDIEAITNEKGQTVGHIGKDSNGNVHITSNGSAKGKAAVGITMASIGAPSAKERSNFGATNNTSNADAPNAKENLANERQYLSNGVESSRSRAYSGARLKTTRTLSLSAQDAKAVEALDIANPLSIKDNLEYGGYIYRKPDGSYGYTAPLKGTSKGFQPSSAAHLVPSGAVIVGDYHTHGDYSIYNLKTGAAIRSSNPLNDQFNSDYFSKGDYRGISIDARRSPDYRGYLGTPSGVFRAFNPHAPKGKQEYIIKL